MKIKKKIAVWSLLCALMVALVPTCSARAEEEYVIPAGKYAFNLTLTEFDLLAEYTNWRLPYYYLYKCGSGYTCLNVFSAGTVSWCESTDIGPTNGSCGFSHSQDYSLSSGWSKNSGYSYGYGYNRTRFFELKEDVSVDSRFYQWFCLNVEDFTGNLLDYYYLDEFCIDAGLKCSASTLESGDVVPFSYDCNYLYMVRQSTTADSLYRYYLTQVNVPRDEVVFPTYSEADGKIVVGLNSLKKTEDVYAVRQYGYDEDGQGWILIDDVASHSVSKEYPVESINCVSSDSNTLVYTSRELYSDADMLEVAVPRSVEYEEVPVITPTPEPIPTVAPSVGVQEQVLYLYTTEFQGTVITPYASIYEVTNGSDDDILVDILKGMNVTIHGWTVDSSGKTWYYCTYTNIYDGEVTGEFTGFVKGDSVGITYGAGDTTEEQDMTLAEQLKVASSFVLSVPLIIGSLFSFLPPWCLTFLGLALSITALLMVLRK